MGEFYVENEYGFAVFQLVLAMLGMGATLTAEDFKDVAREPMAVSFGSAMQLMVMPLLALGFISLFSVPAGVAVGIALIAAVPGGSSSNIFTHFARGNVALSISITAVTTLACLVTTPLILDFLISEHMPADFEMPSFQVMREIFVNVLLPLFIGMAILKYVPHYAAKVSLWCIRGSVLGLAMIFIGASMAGRLDIEKFGHANLMLASLFIAVVVIAAWLLPKLAGIAKADATAIEMEVVVRNINLGMMLKVALFPAVAGQVSQLGDTVLFTLLLYGAVMLLLGIAMVVLKKRNNPVNSLAI